MDVYICFIGFELIYFLEEELLLLKVIKRDCTEVDFQKDKISNAILKAMENGSGIVKPAIAEKIANEIY